MDSLSSWRCDRSEGSYSVSFDLMRVLFQVASNSLSEQDAAAGPGETLGESHTAAGPGQPGCLELRLPRSLHGLLNSSVSESPLPGSLP